MDDNQNNNINNQTPEDTKILHLTEDTFDREVEKGFPLLVEFWAPWCPPCLIMENVLDELALDLSGIVTVARVNVDEENQLVTEYGVMSVPTIFYFENGEEVRRNTGAMSKESLIDFINLPRE